MSSATAIGQGLNTVQKRGGHTHARQRRKAGLGSRERVQQQGGHRGRGAPACSICVRRAFIGGGVPGEYMWRLHPPRLGLPSWLAGCSAMAWVSRQRR